MSPFIVDNRRIDRRVYTAECSTCASCNKADLYKDEFGMPYYFACLTESTAVVFCSPKCSSDWSLENKEKIWNKK